MPKKILEKEALSIPELDKALKHLKEVDESSLNPVQRRTLEYILKFSKIDSEKAALLKQRLIDELGITEEEAVQIINLMPKTIDEVKEIFYQKIILGDLANKILKILWGKNEE